MGSNDKIRLPNSADLFYPKDKEELKQIISSYQSEVELIGKNKREVRAIIVPHAGYDFSGLVSAGVYSLIKGGDYKNIILMGPSHHYPFRAVALDDADYWQTPLGKLKLDELNMQKLLKNEDFQMMPMVFDKEHSLEVQLPWLQSVLRDFDILPMVLGQNINTQEVAVAINKIIKDDTLILVSSDLSHYLPEDEAETIDKRTLNNIVTGKSEGMIEACGSEGILVLMALAKQNNWQAELIDYRTSGEVTGEREAVVGYGGVVFS